MSWSSQIKPLSKPTLATLMQWALGQRTSPFHAEHQLGGLPCDILSAGVPGVISYAVANLDHPSAHFWSLLHGEDSQQNPNKARNIARDFEDIADWRQRFAAGALCALSNHPFPDSMGVFQGLETARSTLVSETTLAELSLMTDMEAPLPMSQSPFSDPVVQETLKQLDHIVELQNRMEDWPQIIQADLMHFPNAVLEPIQSALKRFPVGQGGTPIGSQLTTSLRAYAEELLDTQKLNTMGQLEQTLRIVSCRYGLNRDIVLASHRMAFARARVFADNATQAIAAHHMENLLAATYWLGDPDAQATLHHALGLILRNMTRKVPGLMDAVHHMERAITLRRSLGQTIEAFGTQIDLTSILIQYGPILSMFEECPDSAEDMELKAEAYLQESIDGLARDENNPVANAYQGEAFHNLARLYQTQAKEQQAADCARAALEISEKISNHDLTARANILLAQTHRDPAQSHSHLNAAANLIQQVRRGMAEENVAVAWIGNKQNLFSAQIDFLFEEGQRFMSEEQVCRNLITALEEGRGLTYNRWLGVKSAFNIEDIEQALAEDSKTVLAIYAVGNRNAGVILVNGKEPPSLHLLDISPQQISALALNHLAGLKQQGYVRHASLWNPLQSRFMQEGQQLVKPLAPLTDQDKTICIIPHGPLHTIAFHTLSEDENRDPLGLRVPIISSPSLTNWLVCRKRKINTPSTCLASAAPNDEIEIFKSLINIHDCLESAGFIIQQNICGNADLPSLEGKWGILHLACHGLFRQPHSQFGLLLAADNEPPPQASGEFQEHLLNAHLASPAKLRKSKICGQITFLSACVSARNEEMPGDDLMGITRAIFANGATCLIAGSWTVNSSYVTAFANEFYSQLQSGSVAEAMLHARKTVREINSDPFFWGAFVLQGADTCIALEE